MLIDEKIANAWKLVADTGTPNCLAPAPATPAEIPTQLVRSRPCEGCEGTGDTDAADSRDTQMAATVMQRMRVASSEDNSIPA